jgi:Raf kinase inhibitor-like YbhB/YbcL family protein
MRNTLIALALLATSATSPAVAAQFSASAGGLENGGPVPDSMVLNGMDCKGGNTSPEISWKGAPEGTKSFAVTLYDPDAATGSGFWHWVALDIPANVSALPAGAGDPAGTLLPAGARLGNSDFGAPGYAGACPPPGSGVHHYKLIVHALKTDKLPDLAAKTGALAGFLINANELARAQIELKLKR